MCDNWSMTHEPEILSEDGNALLVICKRCSQMTRIGKDVKGQPEHRLFSEWFKKDALQPDFPLFYKYHHRGKMNVL